MKSEYLIWKEELEGIRSKSWPRPLLSLAALLVLGLVILIWRGA